MNMRRIAFSGVMAVVAPTGSVTASSPAHSG